LRSRNAVVASKGTHLPPADAGVGAEVPVERRFQRPIGGCRRVGPDDLRRRTPHTPTHNGLVVGRLPGCNKRCTTHARLCASQLKTLGAGRTTATTGCGHCLGRHSKTSIGPCKHHSVRQRPVCICAPSSACHGRRCCRGHKRRPPAAPRHPQGRQAKAAYVRSLTLALGAWGLVGVWRVRVRGCGGLCAL
jgi:hypothetical protein